MPWLCVLGQNSPSITVSVSVLKIICLVDADQTHEILYENHFSWNP